MSLITGIEWTNAAALPPGMRRGAGRGLTTDRVVARESAIVYRAKGHHEEAERADALARAASDMLRLLLGVE